MACVVVGLSTRRASALRGQRVNSARSLCCRRLLPNGMGTPHGGPLSPARTSCPRRPEQPINTPVLLMRINIGRPQVLQGMSVRVALLGCMPPSETSPSATANTSVKSAKNSSRRAFQS